MNHHNSNSKHINQCVVYGGVCVKGPSNRSTHSTHFAMASTVHSRAYDFARDQREIEKRVESFQPLAAPPRHDGEF
jgi:hypothetical protein